MATNGGSINYTVKYNVDKTGLNQMKASLQEILNLTHGDLIKINSKATQDDLKKLQDSAKAVGSALERAFNPNLGTLNVSKFNQELKKLNVDKLYKDFNIAGQAGRNAFRNIPDSFKKIVIVNGTQKPWRNEEGFVIMGMKYFLLNSDSLEF